MFLKRSDSDAVWTLIYLCTCVLHLVQICCHKLALYCELWMTNEDKNSPGTPCRVQSKRKSLHQTLHLLENASFFSSQWDLLLRKKLVVGEKSELRSATFRTQKLHFHRAHTVSTIHASDTRISHEAGRGVNESTTCFFTERGLQANVSKTCLFGVDKEAWSPRPLRTRLAARSTYRNTKTPSETISPSLPFHSLSPTKTTRSCWRSGARLNPGGGQITCEREELEEQLLAQKE